MIFVQWSLKAPLGFPRPDRRQVPTQGWVAQVIFVNLYLCISIGFFVLTFLFHKFTLLISSPRPDQDIEEPPSKRLTEPADVLRMPVSDLLIFHLLFIFTRGAACLSKTIYLLWTIFSYFFCSSF